MINLNKKNNKNSKNKTHSFFDIYMKMVLIVSKKSSNNKGKSLKDLREELNSRRKSLENYNPYRDVEV